MINWYKNQKLKMLKSKREAYSIIVQKYRLKWDAIDRKIKGIEDVK